jgi:excisionase family DNA binding protein
MPSAPMTPRMTPTVSARGTFRSDDGSDDGRDDAFDEGAMRPSGFMTISSRRAGADLLATPYAAFSIDETAVILRVNRKTVGAMIDRGDLPAVRYARRRWVPAPALRRLLNGDDVGGSDSSSSAPMISAASRSRSGSQCA